MTNEIVKIDNQGEEKAIVGSTTNHDHRIKIQRIRDYFNETAQRIVPEVHGTHTESWVVLEGKKEHGGELLEKIFCGSDLTPNNLLQVRFFYGLPYQEQDVKKLHELLNSLRSGESHLGICFSEYKFDFPVRLFGNRASFNYGKEYVIPLNDLPHEFQEKRINLQIREDLMKNMIKSKRQLEELVRSGFRLTGDEDVESHIRSVVRSIAEETVYLARCAPIARVKSFDEDLRIYNQKVLQYLGIPYDASNPFSDEGKNAKVTFSGDKFL